MPDRLSLIRKQARFLRSLYRRSFADPATLTRTIDDEELADLFKSAAQTGARAVAAARAIDRR